MLKFYEYVGIGNAEHVLSQSLVWESAQVNGFMHFGTQLRVNGSPYKSLPPLPKSSGQSETHKRVPVSESA